MAAQQQMSSFAKRLGGRVAAANAEHKDKPVDLGNRRLPPGIRNGVAKLSAMYTKEQVEDNGKTPKGETFFRASAIVMSPKEHQGEKTDGMVTQVLIPLCDVPAKGQAKASTFSENWYEFQNLFKMLGVNPPNETPQTDPTGSRTEAYYFSAMKALTDKNNPVYISFSTRGWTPPATPQQPKPQELVFETWHGLGKLEENFDPAAGVTEAPPAPPPQAPQVQPTNSQAAPAAPVAVAPIHADSIYDEVQALVEIATNDPEGATEEGTEASSKLEEMAWRNGWTKQQTGDAANWAAVGEMALNQPTAAVTSVSKQTADTAKVNGSPVGTTVSVGSRWSFAKRTKEGSKLRNSKGEEFPPQEVEVTSVDSSAKTCTAKYVKDGKEVQDIRSRQPINIKFEWLEPLTK